MIVKIDALLRKRGLWFPFCPETRTAPLLLAEEGGMKLASALGKERDKHRLARENTPNGTSTSPVRGVPGKNIFQNFAGIKKKCIFAAESEIISGCRFCGFDDSGGRANALLFCFKKQS